MTNDTFRSSLSLKTDLSKKLQKYLKLLYGKIQIAPSTTKNRYHYLALAIQNLREWVENENRSSFRDSLRRRMCGAVVYATRYEQIYHHEQY